MTQCPAPPERHRDAPRRRHEIRFTTGLKPDALRMKLGSTAHLRPRTYDRPHTATLSRK
jgi:hypothetical protein